jgi:hypothetical protein
MPLGTPVFSESFLWISAAFFRQVHQPTSSQPHTKLSGVAERSAQADI